MNMLLENESRRNNRFTIGDISFTLREVDILSCIICGRTSRKSIAEKLNVSVHTANSHLKAIMQKLDCSSWENIRNFIVRNSYENPLREHFNHIENREKKSTTYQLQLKRPTLNNSEKGIFPFYLENFHRYLLLHKSYLLKYPLIIVVVIAFIIINLLHYNKQSDITLKSEVPLPAVLLYRPMLESKIQNRLNQKQKNRIEPVVIIGPGGSGKTTLSRILAHKHKGVVWEVNAESKESIHLSLTNLLRILANKSGQEKFDEKNILAIAGNDEHLMDFIRTKLKKQQNWLIIFDNVKSLSDIALFTPKSTELWGLGNIIITTRNANIASFFSKDRSFILGELSNAERHKLFSLINPSLYEQLIKQKQIDSLLDKIPSYPLDVLLTAVYLRQSNINWMQYVQLLNGKGSNVIHQEVLKNNYYKNTRYNIIATSIEALLRKNNDFLKLLVICNLMSSQNIPLDILEKCTNRITASSFIEALRSYSLIISDQVIDGSIVFSLHRETLNIISYIVNTNTNIEIRSNIIENLIVELEEYTNFAISNQQYSTIQNLLFHLSFVESTSSFHQYGHLHYITAIKAQIMTTLGFSNPETLKQQTSCLESLYSEQTNQNKLRIANVLSNLAITEGMLGYTDAALEHSKQCCELYEEICPKSYNLALAYKRLSQLYRLKGHYINAFQAILNLYYCSRSLPSKDLFDADFFEVVSMIYGDIGKYKLALKHSVTAVNMKKHSKIPKSLLALSESSLAIAYLDIGYYSEAINTINSVWPEFKKNYGENSIYSDWLSSFLGASYALLNERNKSVQILETLYQTFADSLGVNNYIFYKVALPALADIYIQDGQYSKARALLNKSLELLEQHYGVGHLKTGVAITRLARVEIKTKHYKQARLLLNKAMDIYNQHFHTDIYLTYESFGDLFLLLSEQNRFNNLEKSLQYHKQAINYFQKTKKIIEDNFPKDSMIFKVFFAKLRKIQH